MIHCNKRHVFFGLCVLFAHYYHGPAETLGSDGRSGIKNANSYTTALFLYSKYSFFHVFSNCYSGRHVRVLGEAVRRRPPWAEPCIITSRYEAIIVELKELFVLNGTFITCSGGSHH